MNEQPEHRSVSPEVVAQVYLVALDQWDGDKVRARACLEAYLAGLSGMTPTHTPGPWRHSAMRYGNITANNGEFQVAQVPESNNAGVSDQHAANARLIAAAPELLAACQDTLHGLNNWTTKEFARGYDAGMRDRLRLAIAAARGGSRG